MKKQVATAGGMYFIPWSEELLENSVAHANAIVRLGYPTYTVQGFADTSDALPDTPADHDCHIAVEDGIVFDKTCVEQSILHYTGTEWEVLAYRYDQINYLLSGTGDMNRAVYDPTSVMADAFDMDNMVEGSLNLILTVAERAAITDAATQTWVGNQGFLTSFTETDPIFTAWDKSTGISITESQISDFGAYLTSFNETDPIFTAWDKSTGISITESQISDFGSYALTSHNHSATYQPLDGDLTAIAAIIGTSGFLKKTAADTWALDTNTYLTSFTETDPIFTAWDKSTGISITESQISDFGTYLTSFTETDPIFTAWDKSTGISITESQISDFGSYALASHDHSATYQPLDGDLTAIAAIIGTSGFLKKTAADTWSLDTNTYLTSFTETDPIFTAWDKSTGISITESQISDFGTYLTGITAESIGSLSDVDLTSWAEGKILEFDATGNLVVGVKTSGTGIALTDLSAASPLAYNSGTGEFSVASGFTVPTDTEKANYDTAHGWGDHSLIGYLESSDIADMATQTWVGAQDYLTSVAVADISDFPEYNGATPKTPSAGALTIGFTDADPVTIYTNITANITTLTLTTTGAIKTKLVEWYVKGNYSIDFTSYNKLDGSQDYNGTFAIVQLKAGVDPANGNLAFFYHITNIV